MIDAWTLNHRPVSAISSIPRVVEGPRLLRQVRRPRLRTWVVNVFAGLLGAAITFLLAMGIAMLLPARPPAHLPSLPRIHPVMPNVPE